MSGGRSCGCLDCFKRLIPRRPSPSPPDVQHELTSHSALHPPSAPERPPSGVHDHDNSGLELSHSPGPTDLPLPVADEVFGLFIFGKKRPVEDYDIDVVAVHGLGGHYKKTWTEANGKLWLQDFLPSDLPNARIMSYGYNSKTVFTQTVTDIRDEALMLLDSLNGERRDEKTRPILFICHSLGGIVMKKALILAHERSDAYGDLLKSVRGCVFFGVPHRGSSSAYWGSLAANITEILQLGTNTNTNFIDALQKNSALLDEISQQFIERAALLRIRTFYETKALGGFLIVDKDSARLNLPNEMAVGIPDTTHKTICKFGNASSQKYIRVKNAILDLLGSAVPPSSAPLSEKEKECLQSLYTSNYESHYKRVQTAVDGTCEWFLRHEKYMMWREFGSSLLWVSADPGCGKSVLSSFLVRRLRSPESQATLPGTVCYFFFKDDNDEQKNATFALCALLHQLFTEQNSLVKHAMPQFESKGHKFTEEIHALWGIFTKAAADSGNAICVIDGLDECEESTRRILISSLVKFYSGREGSGVSKYPNTTKNHLKIILTSRPYQSIENGFHDLSRIRLRGEDETNAVSEDVGLVIGARVRRLGSRWHLKDDVQTNLQDTLIKGADRTFLWVSLILGMLEEASEASEREFHEILNNLPTDLDAVYEKILGRSKDLTKAKKILHIVVAAARPLTLEEMNIALAIEPHHKSSEDLEINLIPLGFFESAVKGLCGLFVRVIDSKIYLVHQTAKEFLINDSTTNDPSPGTWKRALDPVESNFIAAKICISYLMFTDFEVSPLRIGRDDRYGSVREIVDLYTSKHTFLDYSAKHWAAHFREAQTKGGVEFLESALVVCGSGSERLLTWLQIFWTTVNNGLCPQILTDLMVASYFGHESVIQLLLEKKVDVNEQDKIYGGALNMAALGKQRDAVRVLLNSGANFYLLGHGYTDLQKKACESR